MSLKNAASLMRLAAGVPRARRILSEFGPDVVIGTGGYTTAAVLIAQRLLGGRSVIHEQNVVPGRTNLLLARFVDRVCVTYESSASGFPARKAEVTGMPIRREFASLPTKADARRRLGLREDAFTILVVGGSQGARALNNLMLAAWRELDDGSTQVLHQVGERNLSEALAAAAGHGASYHVEAYIDMPVAVAAAGMVVCRSGSSTLAEITSAGLPSVLVPYPFAYADHQKTNAQYMVSKGASMLCEEGVCGAGELAAMVSGIRESPDKLAAMSRASAALGRPDAARSVAEVALSLVANSQTLTHNS